MKARVAKKIRKHAIRWFYGGPARHRVGTVAEAERRADWRRYRFSWAAALSVHEYILFAVRGETLPEVAT